MSGLMGGTFNEANELQKQMVRVQVPEYKQAQAYTKKYVYSDDELAEEYARNLQHTYRLGTTDRDIMRHRFEDTSANITREIMNMHNSIAKSMREGKGGESFGNQQKMNQLYLKYFSYNNAIQKLTHNLEYKPLQPQKPWDGNPANFKPRDNPAWDGRYSQYYIPVSSEHNYRVGSPYRPGPQLYVVPSVL